MSLTPRNMSREQLRRQVADLLQTIQEKTEALEEAEREIVRLRADNSVLEVQVSDLRRNAKKR